MNGITIDNLNKLLISFNKMILEFEKDIKILEKIIKRYLNMNTKR